MRHSIPLVIAVVRTVTAQPARAQSSQLTDRQRWPLAASAIIAQRNGDRHDLLGGHEFSLESTSHANSVLFDAWDIKTRDDLFGVLRELRLNGDHALFAQFASFAHEPWTAFSESPDFLQRLKLARTCGPRFGSKSILAWDYVRYIYLFRSGFQANFLSEEEAWSYIEPAAASNRPSRPGKSWAGTSWSDASFDCLETTWPPPPSTHSFNCSARIRAPGAPSLGAPT
jgi:Protein of unknown function (DUF1266)